LEGPIEAEVIEPAQDVEPTPLRPIDDLLAELKSVVAELERHRNGMLFPVLRRTGPLGAGGQRGRSKYAATFA